MSSNDIQMAGTNAANKPAVAGSMPDTNAEKDKKTLNINLAIAEEDNELAVHESNLIAMNSNVYHKVFTDIGEEGLLVSTNRSAQGIIRSVDLLNGRGGNLTNIVATQYQNGATICKPGTLEAAVSFTINEYGRKGHKMVMASFECRPTKDAELRVPMYLGNPRDLRAANRPVESRTERKRKRSPPRGSQQQHQQHGGGKRRRHSPSRQRKPRDEGLLCEY